MTKTADLFGISFELWTQLLAAVLAIYGAYKTSQVRVLADPVTATAIEKKLIVPTLPERSWKMSDSTKHWLIFECPSNVQADILNQIAAAEAERKTAYQITFPGGYSNIEYGLVKGSAGNCGGKN